MVARKKKSKSVIIKNKLKTVVSLYKIFRILKLKFISGHVKINKVTGKGFTALSKKRQRLWIKLRKMTLMQKIMKKIKKFVAYLWEYTMNIRILVKNMIIVVILYGLIINFLVSFFFDCSFTFVSVAAWGLVTYIVKYELPEIIISSRGPKGPPMIKL